MGGYQRERDEHALPMYEFTCQLATMEPPPPEVQQLFGADRSSRSLGCRTVTSVIAAPPRSLLAPAL